MDPQSQPGTPWHERFEIARSVEDVVDACHDFVSQFEPARLAELPRGVLPPVALDAAAISPYAVELVRKDLALGEESPPTLKAFALFFGEASATIARIAMARARRDGWAYVAMRR
ncbi:MAG TPA: hypothetical protein VFV90_11185 [Usitatibacter sp.]|nr:hypothetical protein [Usitatibacter sp.]